MLKNKWIYIGIISLIILLILGKMFMEKKAEATKEALSKDYQQGMKLVQDYVSDYLVGNYEGIEKIEWQGIGVEWRSSPIYGESMFGNYVKSEATIFVSEDVFFKITFRLSDETEYSDEQKKYILEESLNPENIDVVVEAEKSNRLKRLDVNKKLVLERCKKNSQGSPNSKVIYNLDTYDLVY